MTDEPQKKAWARCPACSTVYPNIQIAKDGHKLNCPHDLRLELQKANTKIGALEEKIATLGGNLEDISSDPGLDFDGVEDDLEQVEDETPAEPVIDAGHYISPTAAIDRDDDWDDEEDEPSTASALR